MTDQERPPARHADTADARAQRACAAMYRELDRALDEVRFGLARSASAGERGRGDGRREPDLRA